MRLLDEIFSAFDALADAEGLEKIKTIGDAYMVAGGLPAPRPDHAEAVARRRSRCATRSPRSRQQPGRAGSTSASASTRDRSSPGVIGRRKFIYDLWGDTVNTASRMESHGVPGRGAGDRASRGRCSRGSFRLEPRGTIEVKGKGPMETFLLSELESAGVASS